MKQTVAKSPHTFHIPVMGTGFTIDTPLKVARYGISSVVSLVDDELIEQMRKYHCEQRGESYERIGPREDDHRARRITAYCDLLGRIVDEQVCAMRTQTFEPECDLTKYFEMLPDCPLKDEYLAMLTIEDAAERERCAATLREQITPGTIDVNIMTKVDAESYRGKERLPVEYNDAMAALRGYANSTLSSSLILSAGLNQRLYGYINAFPDFMPDAEGNLKKKIVLKVSDYRSALIQGKFLAKKGVWVSEFRIESGLNCGGHTFASQGYLMGPILDEFKKNRGALIETMWPIYVKGLHDQNANVPESPLSFRVTVQGGIGDAEEDRLLRTYYEVDGTGWATPFMLVPEVTHVDEEHLRKLMGAEEDDVFLSDASPFGFPFWNLRESASERARREQIDKGHPGAACVKGFVRLHKVFGDMPICISSRKYQGERLKEIEEQPMSEERRTLERQRVIAKSCICHDLAGGATKALGIDKKATPAVCCGPNIVNFSRLATLREMVDHIYGRCNLITNPRRPHMFLRELKLYMDYMGKELREQTEGLNERTEKYFEEFRANLQDGIDHYQQLARGFSEEWRVKFLRELEELRRELESMAQPNMATA